MVRILCLLVLLAVSAITSANAAPSDLNKAKRALAQIKSGERDLARSAKRLSETERERLKRNTRGTDSDGDGLADVLEVPLGANRCDADSDDDGLDDNEDSDEDNGDSDGDGVSDANEVETKGLIRSFNDPLLVVGTTTLKITATTVFFRGLMSKADLQPNTCVEAEGHRVGSDILVQKIKKHTGAECGSGSDDD